jgi:hypothetical protein
MIAARWSIWRRALNNVAAQWSNFNIVSNGRHLVEVPKDPDAERRAEHRRAYEAMEAERLATADHATRVGSRVTQFIEAGPPVSEDSASPRGRLTAHIAWLDHARRKAAAAADRLASITVAMGRRADAQAALTDLAASVQANFGRWVQFGSEGERPDDRVAEREALRVVLTETDADSQVADSAAFEFDVAAAVVEALEGMLPALRFAILTESATVFADQIFDAVAALRENYAMLSALGLVIENRAMAKGFDVHLPSTPFGKVGFEVAASDVPSAVAAWRRALEALEADPRAEIVLPGTVKPPRKASAIRTLLRMPT